MSRIQKKMQKQIQTTRYGFVRASRFSLSLFLLVLGGLLGTSGVHVGLVVLVNRLALSGIVQTIIPLIYWIGMSFLFTMFIVHMTKDTYEKPVQQLAEATRKVAEGDFSVYVPTIHTEDKLDYLDVMILDFNRMVEELGGIETLKTDFFSNVSHEIKTPLAVIRNTAQLLRSEKLSEAEKAEYIDTIDRYAGRLTDLITNILKLNKLEKQNIQPKSEPYDLCAQLAECALMFENRWEEKDIEFEADLEDKAVIEADASLLEIVWSNLLSNAIKFTEPGGSVTLRQTSGGDYVEVSVSDTGCGMDDETMKNIFDKFYQGDTSHTTEGNGLGLALVLQIVRMTGGEISAASAPDEGSTFTVKLPVRARQDEVLRSVMGS